MIEINGPPTAWFESYDGTKHIYIVYALAGKDAGDLLQAFATWRMDIEDPGSMLVWRVRPEFTEYVDELTGNILWKLYFRCVVIPILGDGFTVPMKYEGTAPVVLEYRNT